MLHIPETCPPAFSVFPGAPVATHTESLPRALRTRTKRPEADAAFSGSSPNNADCIVYFGLEGDFVERRAYSTCFDGGPARTLL